jgi:hypothetical protein
MTIYHVQIKDRKAYVTDNPVIKNFTASFSDSKPAAEKVADKINRTFDYIDASNNLRNGKPFLYPKGVLIPKTKPERIFKGDPKRFLLGEEINLNSNDSIFVGLVSTDGTYEVLKYNSIN